MSIETIMKKYSDVPRSVVLKYELCRVGCAMAPAALKAFQEVNTEMKGHFMFSWDTGERKTSAQKIPYKYYLKRDDTIFLNRTNDASPYAVDFIDGRFYLTENKQPFEEIYFRPPPHFYNWKTSDGTPMPNIVQSSGDMLFVTINKYCEYYKGGNQCKFCDLVPTTTDQAKRGDEDLVHKPPEQIAEALDAALAESAPRVYRHVIFSGGTILGEYKGMKDLDYYVDCLSRVFKKMRSNQYPSAIQIGPPETKDGWKRLKDTGITSIQPNLEIIDRELFPIICPGKAKSIGYDEWNRRMFEGVEVFGPGRIVPNFVIGCELARAFGQTSIDHAVEVALKGFEFLMKNGVFPRLAIWLVEAKSILGGEEPAPLEYYIKLGRGYTELRHKYGFYDLVVGCRGCWAQDPLYDWDWALRKQKAEAQLNGAQPAGRVKHPTHSS